MKSEIQELFKKIHSSRKLLFSSLELTYKCNLACRFCYNPIVRKGQERKITPGAEAENLLELNEILKLLKDLKRAGVLYLTLTGGEPMMHPHFWNILEKAKEEAFAVRVFTNGSLIDEEAAVCFGRICPNCLEISLYGASDASYEKSTRSGGAFPRVIKALELLKKESATVYLKCMLTSATEDEMDEIQDIADRLGFPLNWDPVLQPSDDGDHYPLKMAASRKALERLFASRRFTVGSSPYKNGEISSVCNIGRNLIHIDPFGEIFPCIEWRESLGNVRNTDIASLWENSPSLRELMDLSEMIGQKMSAGDIKYRFCMGRSKQLYGDPTVPDACELKIARLRKKYSQSEGG